MLALDQVALPMTPSLISHVLVVERNGADERGVADRQLRHEDGVEVGAVEVDRRVHRLLADGGETPVHARAVAVGDG